MNFLRRIELQGFKSFAQKVSLEFPSRVVAVVGPNGSGKSNIIDAFRWILGEREAKHLRGDTLGNLIFAGTPARPPAGFAKAVLYFDNSSKLFPFDAEEIMLVRRVDRSGVSQFFLHDAEIRLKDLIPLLARAKLGSRGLTMIGQGESDIFVRASGEERRTMIEEVLGLREYRIKKAQAERRLVSSEVNMDKARAMIEELMPHLRLLRRQKHRWDKRSELASMLREFENQYFAFEHRGLQEKLRGLETPLKKFDEVKSEHKAYIEHLEKEVKALDKKAEDHGTGRELREKINSLIDRRLELQRALARCETKIEFRAREEKAPDINTGELLELMEHLREEFKTVLAWNDIEKIRSSLQEWISKLNRVLHKDVKAIDEAFKEEFAELKAAVLKLDNEIVKTREEEEQIADVREKANQEFRSLIERLEAKKNELRRIEEEEHGAFFEKEKLQLRLEELTREWRGFGREADELPSLVVQEGYGTREELEKKMMRLRGELAAIGEIDENLVQEAEETEKRYEFLDRELKDLEHAIKDLKTLISSLEKQIHESFKTAFKSINEEFNTYFKLMFGGGKARLKLERIEAPPEEEATSGEGVSEGSETEKKELPKEEERDPELSAGVEIDLQIPRKRIKSLDMLSGGEKSLVSVAALFALISVSPPPFLVLDEIDAPLDEENARRFAELIKEFSKKTQFVIVTHNRATMEAADILYGVTMGEDGTSKVLSLKLENAA